MERGSDRNRRTDVVVIGGGHAGCEAAAAAARLGASTVLLTQSRAKIGEMSCNPAIGGLGKGHLVREIDALGGVMAQAADKAGIQFKVLNRSKGPAVRGPRAQADRALYRQAVQELLSATNDLLVVEGEAVDLAVAGGRVTGVILASGETIGCGAVVLTTGTFLRGVIHLGDTSYPAGRYGEAASNSLSATLARAGLRLGRLKTGTPPRLERASIDWAGLEPQTGDDPPEPFSALTSSIDTPQVECRITRTTTQTHRIIRENIGRSAMYSGRIASKGPRYCPSIEDKIVRFADRDSHQVFLEPEGLDDPLVYPNGISTSLPEDVQTLLVRSMPGLEHARIVRPGYAIEYDHVDPRELSPALQCLKIGRLFLAGQINGTTGYEEAAAQGLVAGLNAALVAGGSEPILLTRADAYTGVMIDDLVTRGVSEPYRMFTSRAEYRLSLRADNADQRLTPIGIKLGCVSSDRAARFAAKERALREARTRLDSLRLTPAEAAERGLKLAQDGVAKSAFTLLASPDIRWAQLAEIWPELRAVPPKIAEQVSVDAQYSVYLARQQAEIEAMRRDEALELVPDLDYFRIAGLSREVQVKLAEVRPSTLAQAGRIEGITPAALTRLLGHVKRRDTPRAHAAGA